ncbi:MAG: hypothetical protein V1839_01260 [archaeon]
MKLDEILRDEKKVLSITKSEMPREELLQIYDAVAREMFEHHYKNSPVYRAIADAWEVTPDNWDGDFANLPTIESGLFKEPHVYDEQTIAKRESVFSVPASELVLRHHSSGSSGKKSVVARDQATVNRSEILEGLAVKEIYGAPDGAFVAMMLPQPEVAYMAYAVKRCYEKIGCEARTYINIQPNERGPPTVTVNTKEMMQDIGKALAEKKPVILVTTPAGLMLTMNGLKQNGRKLPVAQVVLGGGWWLKPHEVRSDVPAETTPEYLQSLASEVFAGKPLIWDALGMTEISLIAGSCLNGYIRDLHPLPFLIPVIKDIKTKKAITEPGVEGELSWFDLTNTAFPAFLSTGDKAKYVSTGKCSNCNSNAPAVRILGRIFQIGTDEDKYGCNANLEAQLNTVKDKLNW